MGAALRGFVTGATSGAGAVTTTTRADGADRVGLGAAGRGARSIAVSGSPLAWIRRSPDGAGIAKACDGDFASPSVSVGSTIAQAMPAVASVGVSARAMIDLMFVPPPAEKSY
jgi:hypothetical protein